MTKYSFTHIARYLDNEARAYAHYVKHDEMAYDLGTSDALIYGKVAHAILADEEPDLSDDEVKAMFLRGKPENGLKKVFNSYRAATEIASRLRQELVGTEFETEKDFENDIFKGRVDTITDDTVIDFKFVAVKNFDKEWNGVRYDDWIYSTHYLLQAFIYLNMTGRRNYYIVAIDKNSLSHRVYDLSKVISNFEMGDAVQATLTRIEQIESGEIEPEFKNDGSEWSRNYLMNKPFEKSDIVGVDFDGLL